MQCKHCLSLPPSPMLILKPNSAGPNHLCKYSLIRKEPSCVFIFQSQMRGEQYVDCAMHISSNPNACAPNSTKSMCSYERNSYSSQCNRWFCHQKILDSHPKIRERRKNTKVFIRQIFLAEWSSLKSYLTKIPMTRKCWKCAIRNENIQLRSIHIGKRKSHDQVRFRSIVIIGQLQLLYYIYGIC